MSIVRGTLTSKTWSCHYHNTWLLSTLQKPVTKLAGGRTHGYSNSPAHLPSLQSLKWRALGMFGCNKLNVERMLVWRAQKYVSHTVNLPPGAIFTKEVSPTLVKLPFEWCFSFTWVVFLAKVDTDIYSTALILGLHPANERQLYFVTTSLIGWT